MKEKGFDNLDDDEENLPITNLTFWKLKALLLQRMLTDCKQNEQWMMCMM